MANTIIKTVADLDAFKAMVLADGYAVAHIGSCYIAASRHSQSGKLRVTFKISNRRASYAELVELVGYL